MTRDRDQAVRPVVGSDKGAGQCLPRLTLPHNLETVHVVSQWISHRTRTFTACSARSRLR